MCPPVRVYWRHLANTIEIVLPWAHPSPQPKRQVDRFSRFCTAFAQIGLAVSAVKTQGGKSLYFTVGASFSQNCPSHWGSGPSSNLWFPGPLRVHNPNGITIGSAVFAQMTAETLIF